MSMERLIKDVQHIADCCYQGSSWAQILREAVDKLRTHPDAQPNEPLTLEDLRGMHEPVWVSVPRLKNGGYWCLCNGGTIIPPSCQEFDARDVKDWVFYRRPPKEESV